MISQLPFRNTLFRLCSKVTMSLALRRPVRTSSYSLARPHLKLNVFFFRCHVKGSGKTAAYLIPILSKLMGKAKKLAAPRPNPATFREGVDQVTAEPLVLVVAPTRELAVQIFNEARKFCYRTMLRPCVVYGGLPIKEQIGLLSRGCDILVGTPGRLVDFISRPNVLTLRRLKYIVIDEADEMLEGDWEDEFRQILTGGGKSPAFYVMI